MAVRALYADSFGGIQQARQQDDAARQATAQYWQEYFARQKQQQFQNRRLSYLDQQQAQQLALENQFRKEQAMENRQDRDVSLELRRGELLERGAKRNFDEQYTNRLLEMEQGRAGLPTPKQEMDMALMEVEEGTFDPANYPTLPPRTLQYLSRLEAPRQAEQSRAYKTAEEVALAANRMNQIRRGDVERQASMKAGDENVGFWPRMWASASGVGLPMVLGSRRPRSVEDNPMAVQRLAEHQRNLAPYLDPKAGYVERMPTGEFVPSPALRPRQMSRMYVAPPVAPGATNFMDVPFTQPMPGVIDLPPSAVNVTRQPANPYIPGRRYGNLRYVGGNPLDERSWQPVQ